jgi:nucleoside-diphosphate-sugar epimerase
MSRFLITGASGFIGGVVLRKLIQRYGSASLVVLTSQAEQHQFEHLGLKILCHNGYQFESDFFVRNAVEGVECLLHLGAFTPKSKAEANDILRSNSNIVATTALLQSQLPKLKKVIFTSTLDVYAEAPLLTEASATNPTSLYGASKLYCESLVSAFANQYGCVHQLLRIGHVFGVGEEKYKKIIPLTIEKLLRNEPVEIWGDGEALRTFIYVEDVGEAIVNALDLEAFAGVVNVVGNEAITINDLVECLIRISGKAVRPVYKPATVVNQHFVFDNTKLKHLLLKEFTPLEVGLQVEYQHMQGLT